MIRNFLRGLVLFSLFMTLFHMVLVNYAVGNRVCQNPLSEKITLQLQAEEYEIIDISNGDYQSIRMRQFSTMSDYERPMLPYRIKEILLPKNIDRSSLRVEVFPFQASPLPGTYKIKPAPRPEVPEGEHWVSRIPSQREDYFYSTVYLQNRFFPENPITMMPLTMKSYQDDLFNIVRLVFSPFQYNPITRELQLAKDAKVTVYYNVCNSDEAEFSLDTNASTTKYDYVIITTDQIKAESSELANFVKHKEILGFSVKIVTEEDFDKLDGPAPNRRAEKIRQWLINNFEAMGIKYVLLVGNPDPDDPMYSEDVGDEKGDLTYEKDDYIPMKQIWHALPGRGFADSGHDPYFLYNAPLVHWGDATDWYYADLTGNWDADGDGFYGESPWVSQAGVETSPLPLGIDKSAFSIRWTKTINIPIAGEVTFNVRHWKGLRIIIDGDIIVKNWPTAKQKSDQENIAISLSSGIHTLMVEYYQDTGHGHIQVQMDGEIVDGCTGEYFDNTNFKGTPAVRYNESLWKNWETSDYSTDTSENEFGLFGSVDLDAEVSVGRIPVYDNDYDILDQILARIITYETENDTSWRRSLLLPTKTMRSDGDSVKDKAYTLSELIYHNIAQPKNFETFRIYDRDYGLSPAPDVTPCTEPNVRDAWNLGFGVVVWETHGTFRYAGEVLDVQHRLSDLSTWWYDTARTLLDHSVSSIVFMASCHNGTIYLPDCYKNPLRCTPDRSRSDGRIGLGYALFKDAAIATVSASEVSTGRNGSVDFAPGTTISYRSDLLNEHLSYLFANETIANENAVGDALKNIKYTHFHGTGMDYENYHQQLIYNLYGDPGLHLNPGIPAIENTGSLRVTISPQRAIDAGAQWRRSGTSTWRNSDDTENDITEGPHFVVFKDISGWNKPLNQSVAISEGQTTNITGVYTQVEPPVGAPSAGFSATPTSGQAPLTVSFTSTSTGDITAYLWNFGDGATGTSQNITHVYQTVGYFSVSLTVTGPGGSDTETKTGYVEVTEAVAPPVAEFSANPIDGDTPLEVDFVSTSTGTITSYAWDFGDGNTSAAQNPTHTYDAPGTLFRASRGYRSGRY